MDSPDRVSRVPAEVESAWSGSTLARGTAFGYLGVRIDGDQVWTIGGSVHGRFLGQLAGARAGMEAVRLTPLAARLVAWGLGQRPMGRIFVALANGTQYERLLRPAAFGDLNKIAAEIARFNQAAGAARPAGPSDSAGSPGR
jgi:hypothetical protein